MQFFMKTGIMLLVMVAVLMSCAKESEELELSAIVKYEVLVAEGIWYGEYISETGEKICFCYPPFPESGWTYTFEVTKKPFTLHIDASADKNGLPDSPDVTTKIYIDDELVVSNTSNWAPGVASADFEIE